MDIMSQWALYNCDKPVAEVFRGLGLDVCLQIAAQARIVGISKEGDL